MKALILAAGIGSRLRPLTYNVPKCLIQVKEKPILENALEHLNKNNIETVVIVVGYLGGKVQEYFGDQFRSTRLIYVENKAFNVTDNIYSVWLAKKHLNDDVLLLDADVLFEGKVIERVCKHNYSNIIVVDEYKSFMTGTGVNVDHEIVTEMILAKGVCPNIQPHPMLKTINIYRFSKEFMEKYFIPTLDECIEEGYHDEFYEFVIRKIIESNVVQLMALSIGGLKWCEIDTSKDLQVAERLFGKR